MERCIIFAGGKAEQRLPEGVDPKGAFIIAADKGYESCRRLGLAPDLAIGDFDSLGYVPSDCEVIRFPAKKDYTDLMTAAMEALKRGCNDITILSAMGGRADHMYGNIQTLCYIVKKGGSARMLSCCEEIAILPAGEYCINKKENTSLSLFAYSPNVKGLTISGAEYPLDNGQISYDFPIGVSNEITADTAHIRFEEGLLLMVQSRLDKDV